MYGVLAGIKGGVRAGVAAGETAVRGTVLAGNVVAGAPTYAWQSASKVRSFVRLAVAGGGGAGPGGAEDPVRRQVEGGRFRARRS